MKPGLLKTQSLRLRNLWFTDEHVRLADYGYWVGWIFNAPAKGLDSPFARLI